MTVIFLIVALLTHYMAYVLGEESAGRKWIVQMRNLQGRFDDFVYMQLKRIKEEAEKKKEAIVKKRKVAVKKKK